MRSALISKEIVSKILIIEGKCLLWVQCVVYGSLCIHCFQCNNMICKTLCWCTVEMAVEHLIMEKYSVREPQGVLYGQCPPIGTNDATFFIYDINVMLFSLMAGPHEYMAILCCHSNLLHVHNIGFGWGHGPQRWLIYIVFGLHRIPLVTGCSCTCKLAPKWYFLVNVNYKCQYCTPWIFNAAAM